MEGEPQPLTAAPGTSLVHLFWQSLKIPGFPGMSARLLPQVGLTHCLEGTSVSEAQSPSLSESALPPAHRRPPASLGLPEWRELLPGAQCFVYLKKNRSRIIFIF